MHPIVVTLLALTIGALAVFVVGPLLIVLAGWIVSKIMPEEE